ncbi:MAG: hypothetical protein K6E10_10380 [Eubacterium sp.]|nr:hypothetical protein [Eubacterium sp.]
MINKEAKDLILNRRSIKNITKDVWMGMCCTAFGDAFFDSKPCAKHRRNPGAFSSQDKTFFQIQADRYKKFFKNDGLKNVYSVMEEFEEIFRDDLADDKKEILKFFLNKSPNPIHRLKKVFYPKRLRYDLKDDIMLRKIFLLGLL